MRPGRLDSSGSALRGFLRLPFRRKLTVIHVLIIALLVESAIRVASVHKVARWLGVPFQPVDELPPFGATRVPELSEREKRRAGLTLAVMEYWPFAEGTCLRQSLVLGRILRRHDPILRLGVGKKDGEIAAHAWIEIGEATVGFDGSFLPFRTTV